MNLDNILSGVLESITNLQQYIKVLKDEIVALNNVVKLKDKEISELKTKLDRRIDDKS